MVTIKSKREIELMKESCKLVALTYDMLEKNIKPGMSTYDLDQMADKFIREHGGIPAQKGYPSGVRGVPAFPGTLCTSINDTVIHGIPSKSTIIKDGDIVSVDFSKGWGEKITGHLIVKKGIDEYYVRLQPFKNVFTVSEFFDYIRDYSEICFETKETR